MKAMGVEQDSGGDGVYVVCEKKTDKDMDIAGCGIK